MKALPHAAVRAKQRYGLDLTGRDLTTIAEAIQENRGKLIGRLTGDLTVWKLKWNGTWVRVVIDPTFYRVVTFLPKSGPVHLRRAIRRRPSLDRH